MVGFLDCAVFRHISSQTYGEKSAQIHKANLLDNSIEIEKNNINKDQLVKPLAKHKDINSFVSKVNQT